MPKLTPDHDSGQVSDSVTLSIVVPCFNEGLVISQLLARLTSAAEACVGNDYEIILVDDGSRDDTWNLITQAARSSQLVRGIRLSRNFGHQYALTAGLDSATGDFILIIDADLQDPPELLPFMLSLAREGHDVVYGVRRVRHGDGPFKRFSAHIFYRLLDLLVEIKVPRDAGDFRLITRRALDEISRLREGHRYMRGMVAWIGLAQVPFYYDREARHAGVSKYPFRKMLALATNAITSFSIKPLRLVLLLSLAWIALAFILLIWVLLQYFNGETVPGWASLGVFILILGGMQLFATAIIAEYVGKIFESSKGRPLYVVQERVGGRFR